MARRKIGRLESHYSNRKKREVFKESAAPQSLSKVKRQNKVSRAMSLLLISYQCAPLDSLLNTLNLGLTVFILFCTGLPRGTTSLLIFNNHITDQDPTSP